MIKPVISSFFNKFNQVYKYSTIANKKNEIPNIVKFNLGMWNCKSCINRFISKIYPEDKKFIIWKSAHTHKEFEVGDIIKINGKFKKIIGFNGSHSPDEVLTKSGEIFYGNEYVARTYAKMRAKSTGDGYIRAITVNADVELEDKHHGEPWYEGNWHPIHQEAIKELELEVIAIKKYRFKGA